MTNRRKAAFAAAAVAVLLLLFLGLAPLLFRGPIEGRVKREAAAALDARVDWRRVDVGLLRSFPNLSLRLHDLTVAGVRQFESDTLLAVPQLALSLDVSSALASMRGRGPLVIRSVHVTAPHARLLMLEDGSANWRITKPHFAADTGGTRALAVRLAHLALRDARITLDNRQSRLVMRVAGLNHTLRGDFAKQRFDLLTETAADTVSVRFAGVPYLNDVRVVLDASLAADLAERRFTVSDNRILINDLALVANGSVAAGDGGSVIDLDFSAPQAEFRQLLSLVPAVYAQDFASLETAGRAAVRGAVRGVLGAGSLPSFALEADVADAMFRYPDLPLPARDIALHLSLTNPGGSADASVLNVDRFHVMLGDDVVDGSFVLRTPISDPDVAFRVAGTLDLANVPRTLKLPDVQQLAGVVRANAEMRARESDITAERFERVSAAGTIEVQQLALQSAALRQPIAIEEAVLRLTPQHAELASFRGSAGSSDMQMTGTLDNIIGFMLRGEGLRGRARVTSTRLDLDEWRSDDAMTTIVVPGNIDFALDARADTVRLGTLVLHDASGALRIRDRRVTLTDVGMAALGGGITASGWYETVDPLRPAFDVALTLTEVDVPATFAALRTVQAFAPAARYAEGAASIQLEVNGTLGADMMPVYTQMTGLGSLTTRGLVLRGFPALDRLADALRLDLLRDPGFRDLQSSFAIRDGRLEVQPFAVRVGEVALNVSGSNGVDQTLDYDISLHLPRSVLGADANRAVRAIADRTAQLGLEIESANVITLGVTLGGTVTDPTVTTNVRDASTGAVAGVESALRDEAERRRALAEARADSAAEAARARALAEAQRLLADADSTAAAIRQEARVHAERLRAEANMRIDSLEAAATSPAARIAARAAADRLRREADARADAVVRAADTRADSVMATARRRADLPSDSTRTS
jgi:hypothetical protein